MLSLNLADHILQNASGGTHIGSSTVAGIVATHAYPSRVHSRVLFVPDVPLHASTSSKFGVQLHLYVIVVFIAPL